MKYTYMKLLQKGKFGQNSSVYLTEEGHILKVQEGDETTFLKYAAQYPNQFVRLLDHTKEKLHYYLYEKLDFIVSTMKLTQNQLYSMIVQVALITRQMRQDGWVHGDLHAGNIGANAVNYKTIVINGTTVPTYGYRFKLLDFGLVANKKDTDPVKKDYYETGINLNHAGAGLWELLVPSMYKGKYNEEMANMIHIENGLVRRAVYKVMRKESKTTVPVNDILFFAKHGILSDETIHYIKLKMDT